MQFCEISAEGVQLIAIQKFAFIRNFKYNSNLNLKANRNVHD